MTPEDVTDFLNARTEPPCIVIAPDRRRQGSNLLFTKPADLLTFSYGKESFTRHIELAKEKHAQVVVIENERIALDLDLPEDYALLNAANAIPVFTEI